MLLFGLLKLRSHSLLFLVDALSHLGLLVSQLDSEQLLHFSQLRVLFFGQVQRVSLVEQLRDESEVELPVAVDDVLRSDESAATQLHRAVDDELCSPVHVPLPGKETSIAIRRSNAG